MSTPAFKPSEGKREEFRKYLEKNGVMDALTKVLVNLYEEGDKPEDALEYIRDRLAMQAGIEIYSQMKAKIDECEGRIEELNKEVEALKLQLEPPPPVEEAQDVVPEGENPPQDEIPPPQEETPPEQPAEEPAEQPAEQPPAE